MNFKPVENKQLHCITESKPACQVFGSTDVNDVLGNLGKDTVYPVLGVGDTKIIAGIVGDWYKIEYKSAPDEVGYVWVTPDRAVIEDVPEDPVPQPELPTADTVEVTVKVPVDKLAKFAELLKALEG